MKKLFSSLVLFVCILGFSMPATKAASYIGGNDSAEVKETQGDVFVAAQRAVVSGLVKGELFAAGTDVSIEEKPERSIFTVGRRIEIKKGSGYNLYAAGSEIILDGEFAHDVYVFGQSVILKPGTIILGDLRAAGSEVKLDGVIKGSVYLDNPTTTSKAVISGDFHSTVSNLTFSGGSIGGNLMYTSKSDASGLDKVAVAGTVKRSTPAAEPERDRVNFSWGNVLYSIASLLVLGAALLLVARRLVKESLESFHENWRGVFGKGLLFFFIVPLFCLLLLFTVVGWKIMAILISLYIIVCMIGGIIGLFWIGQELGRQLKLGTPTLARALAIGTVAVSVMHELPVVGFLVMVLVFFFATLPGMGAVIQWIQEKAK